MSRDEYLVRGATLICTNGSHKRKINIPKCHGVSLGVHPVLHELECLAEPACGRDKCNITPFGVCIPEEGSPPPTETVTYKKTKLNSKDGKNGKVTGCKCMPEIIGTWRNAFMFARIVDNGDKNPEDRQRTAPIYAYGPIGQSTITMSSFLICKYGGIISPVDSGQYNGISESDFCNMEDYFRLVQKQSRNGNPIKYK